MTSWLEGLEEAVTKWNNLPAELLQTVGRLMGISSWASESARQIVGDDIPTVRLWRRFGEFVAIVERRAGMGVSVSSDVSWNEVPRDLTVATIASLFIHVFCEVERRTFSMHASDKEICDHVAGCSGHQGQLLMAMELLLGVISRDERFFYLHMMPGMVFSHVVVPTSALRSDQPIDENTPTDSESERKFRQMCEGSQEAQRLFKRWESGGSQGGPEKH